MYRSPLPLASVLCSTAWRGTAVTSRTSKDQGVSFQSAVAERRFSAPATRSVRVFFGCPSSHVDRFIPSAYCASRAAIATVNASAASHDRGRHNQHLSAVGRMSAASTAAQRQRQHEAEEDKRLEEEEFAEVHRGMDSSDEEASGHPAATGDVNVANGSALHRVVRHLQRRANALDKERQRLRWELWERRQLLASVHPASLLGRPPNVAVVLRRIAATSLKNGDDHDASFYPYLNWKGSSVTPVRWWGALCGCFVTGQAAVSRTDGPPPPPHGAVTTLTEDIEYLRRYRALHLLSHYQRMTMTPKRNLWHSVFHMGWNAYIGVQNACAALLSYPFQPQHSTNSASSESADSSPHVERGARPVTGPVTPLSFGLGICKGFGVSLTFLFYGFVLSPLIHVTSGVYNSVYGAYNFVTGRLMFDALSGRWARCTVLDTQLLRLELQREKRLLRAIGRMEFKRRRMKSEDKWKDRMASLGFSMENFQERMTGGRGSFQKAQKGNLPKSKKTFNPYEVLNVKRSAPVAAIKSQYKKLAMVFHPDVAQSHSGGPLTDSERRHAQEKFEEISSAYQILSNPEKRKAYDLGGEEGLAMHASQYGHFLARTPEEVVQSLFGGEAFRCLLVGELLRSHWALRYEAQVSVSLHELEGLQSIRIRQIALELAQMADVHAMAVPASSSNAEPSSPTTSRRSKTRHSASSLRCKPAGGANPNKGGSRVLPTPTPESNGIPLDDPDANFAPEFRERCAAFVLRMSDACFGRELLHEVGLSYVAGARRFLRLTPFYAPKALVTRKIFSGIDRVWYAFQDAKSPNKEDPHATQIVARKIMVEYFNMEYDNVVADLHICLRFAVQMVLQDVSVSPQIQRRRCYAVWYIGQQMLDRGLPFGAARKEDDGEMLAYIQQAATAQATTAKPKPF